MKYSKYDEPITDTSHADSAVDAYRKARDEMLNQERWALYELGRVMRELKDEEVVHRARTLYNQIAGRM